MTFKYDSPELCWLWFLLPKTLSPCGHHSRNLGNVSWVIHFLLLHVWQLPNGWRTERRANGMHSSVTLGTTFLGSESRGPFLQSAGSCRVFRACECPSVHIQALDCLELGLGESRGKMWYLLSLQQHFDISVPSTICFPASSEKSLFILSVPHTFMRARSRRRILIPSQLQQWSEKKIVILRSLFQLKINQRIWNQKSCSHCFGLSALVFLIIRSKN